MQSLGYDLIVDDDGIIQEAGKIVEKTEDFEQKLGELSDILSNVLDDAIMQGNTAENLMLFAAEVQGPPASKHCCDACRGGPWKDVS